MPPIKKSHLAATLLASLLVISCAGEPSVGTDLAGPLIPHFSEWAGSTTCGGSGTNNEYDNGVDRTCLTNGPVSFTLSNISTSAVSTAMSKWNSFLKEAPELPTLGTQESGGIPLIGYGTSNMSLYCGQTSPGSGGKVSAMHIYPAESSECDTRQTSFLENILVHEFAHALGWNRGHGGYPIATTATTAGCATFLGKKLDSIPITGIVCRHDVEALFRAYFNTSGWTWNAAYFNSAMLWTTDAPSSVSLAASSTTQVNISKWYGAPSGQANYGNSSVNWVAASGAPFSVNSTGLVTAGSTADTAKLYLKASATPPSGFLTWTPFARKGDSVTVNVTAGPPPPPPLPFQVDSIWAAQMPITSVGWTTVFASVASPPGTPVAIRWIVSDSRTPTLADTNVYYGLQRDVYASEGSYTLSIRARPQYGSTFGLEYFQDIPVCNEGRGGQASAEPSKGSQATSKKGDGPTPDAVGGC